jgi:hypothetical protein
VVRDPPGVNRYPPTGGDKYPLTSRCPRESLVV